MQDYARAVLHQMAVGATAVVPNLFAFEAANVLVKSQKRGLVSEAGARKFIALLADLDIETDLTTHECAPQATVGIALQHDLSAYDTACLELALREGLPLATLDHALKAVVVKADGARVSLT